MTVLKISRTGTIRWHNKEGKVHREGDLPAIIFSDGCKIWKINGDTHREGNLPSVIDSDGYLAWYKNGEFIRCDFSEEVSL